METVRVLGEGGHAVEVDKPVAGGTQMYHGGASAARADVVSAGATTKVPMAASAPGGGHDTIAMTAMEATATKPQIAAISLFSVAVLAVGVLLGALYGELSMSSRMESQSPVTPTMSMLR